MQEQEIIEMLKRGISIFPKGYLITLGEMQKVGLIKCEIYKDGNTKVTLLTTHP